MQNVIHTDTTWQGAYRHSEASLKGIIVKEATTRCQKVRKKLEMPHVRYIFPK